MSEEHAHRMRYTVYMDGQWGGSVKQVFIGTGSSLKDGELLIVGVNGAFYSVNYARVRWMEAEPLAHDHD